MGRGGGRGERVRRGEGWERGGGGEGKREMVGRGREGEEEGGMVRGEKGGGTPC